MGNPLVNELIIPIGRKDFWNATEPEDEAQFLASYQSLDVATALGSVAGVPVPPTPRDDVVERPPQVRRPERRHASPSCCASTSTVPPTPPAQIKRLGPFAHDAVGGPTPDPAGFPNGRRPNDDVTDIVVRVAGGSVFIQNFVGDGVGVSELGITPDFPFVPTALRRPQSPPPRSRRAGVTTPLQPRRRAARLLVALMMLAGAVPLLPVLVRGRGILPRPDVPRLLDVASRAMRKRARDRRPDLVRPRAGRGRSGARDRARRLHGAADRGLGATRPARVPRRPAHSPSRRSCASRATG